MNRRANKWIGQRTIRPDGADKVTGRAAFAADASMPGMIWGCILRAPHAHALIRGIHTGRAKAIPGVKAVVTSHDVVDFPIATPAPCGIQDMRWMSRNVMAREKVLFHGHPVAAVAATTAAIAEAACALIEVDYELLPFAIEIDDALSPGAPILFDHIRFEGMPSNISNIKELRAGDVTRAFAEAEVVVERRFTTKPVHQGYIEPHACVASVLDEKATVWSSSQGHFMVRSMTALLTGLRESAVRAIPAEIGGGFGGKTIVYLEPIAALLSRKSGRPVKLEMSREDVMRATGPTSGSKSRVKLGATRDGRILAAEARVHLQAGAFPGAPLPGAVAGAFCPYNIPNLDVVGLEVLCNRPKVAAYRAPGGPIGAFAVESTLDELAQALGMDPLELRLRNISAAGEGAAGLTAPSNGHREVLEAARAHPHYHAPLNRHRGRGVASGYWFNAAGESSAGVNISGDGNVLVTTGHPDIGGSRAAIANITAELLGIDIARVSVLIGDTATIGYSEITNGSRVLFASSAAVTRSVEAVTQQLCRRAARIWGIDANAVRWENGEARPAGENAGSFPALTLADLAARAAETGGPIGASARLNTEGAVGGFATHICDVEVDAELGLVRVVRYTAVQNVGRAIHPAYVEGQMQGGAAQGIGWALNEEYVYTADGQVDNPSLLDYRMPVASDLPMIDTVIVEVPNPNHPHGVIGVGEVPIVPPLAAVANAVKDALGLRLTNLPMSPPKVLAAIEAQKITAAR